MSGEDKLVTRRKVLTLAGALGAGAAIAGLGGLARAEAGDVPAEKWPWPYVKLDPVKTAELAYAEWYRVYCGAAVISSVFTQLREKVGEPYKSFPIDAFIFLEGGVSGWGTICGSNAGANIVTNLIIGPRTSGSEDGMYMGSELLQWYSDAAMPIYLPKEPKVKTDIVKTTSGSPLCHVSVGKWMAASGKSLKSPERRDRCARVTASVAYHLVELLNDWKDGKYETEGEVPSAIFGITAQHNCTDCHGDKVPSPPMDAPAPAAPTVNKT
ncbi:MAG TPA: C-GCAxxG-C-C family protein [Nitrospirota bacterium]|nr:C-GCAxxG-C-C family protein [Nitrospirota bacterium]